jgi:hypothetical protein
MSVLYDTKFDSKFHLELVDGHDITNTYANKNIRTCVDECRARGYAYDPSAKLVRLIKCSLFSRPKVALRALVWNAFYDGDNTPVVYLDRVYTEEQHGRSPGLKRDFIDCWRESVKGEAFDRPHGAQLYIPYHPYNAFIQPYFDTFRYTYNKMRLNFDKGWADRLRKIGAEMLEELHHTYTSTTSGTITIKF